MPPTLKNTHKPSWIHWLVLPFSCSTTSLSPLVLPPPVIWSVPNLVSRFSFFLHFLRWFSTCFFRDKLSHWICIGLDWLVIKPQGPACIYPSTGITGACHCTWIFDVCDRSSCMRGKHLNEWCSALYLVFQEYWIHTIICSSEVLCILGIWTCLLFKHFLKLLHLLLF